MYREQTDSWQTLLVNVTQTTATTNKMLNCMMSEKMGILWRRYQNKDTERRKTNKQKKHLKSNPLKYKLFSFQIKIMRLILEQSAFRVPANYWRPLLEKLELPVKLSLPKWDKRNLNFGIPYWNDFSPPNYINSYLGEQRITTLVLPCPWCLWCNKLERKNTCQI